MSACESGRGGRRSGRDAEWELWMCVYVAISLSMCVQLFYLGEISHGKP